MMMIEGGVDSEMFIGLLCTPKIVCFNYQKYLLVLILCFFLFNINYFGFCLTFNKIDDIMLNVCIFHVCILFNINYFFIIIIIELL